MVGGRDTSRCSGLRMLGHAHAGLQSACWAMHMLGYSAHAELQRMLGYSAHAGLRRLVCSAGVDIVMRLGCWA